MIIMFILFYYCFTILVYLFEVTIGL